MGKEKMKNKKQVKKGKVIKSKEGIKTMHVHDGACGCSGAKGKKSDSGCGCC